jgi:hypothetical protein
MAVMDLSLNKVVGNANKSRLIRVVRDHCAEQRWQG